MRQAIAAPAAIAAGESSIKPMTELQWTARIKLLAVAQLCFDSQAQPLTRQGASAQYEHYALIFKGLQEIAAHMETPNWAEALMWAELSRGQAIWRPNQLQPSKWVQSLAGTILKHIFHALAACEPLHAAYQSLQRPQSFSACPLPEMLIYFCMLDAMSTILITSWQLQCRGACRCQLDFSG